MMIGVPRADVHRAFFIDEPKWLQAEKLKFKHEQYSWFQLDSMI